MRQILIIAALAAMLLVSTAAIAQQEKLEMQPPPMPNEIGRLDQFVGDWSGDGKLISMGKSCEAKISHKFIKFPFGWGLEMLERSEIPGSPTYYAHNMMGFYMGGGKYHLYTVSNYGDVHDHVGNWASDKELYLQYDGMMEGQKYLEKLHIMVDSPSQYSFADTVEMGGQIAQVFTATMKKQ